MNGEGRDRERSKGGRDLGMVLVWVSGRIV